MSRLFGPVYQNGYVVKDMDAALDLWINKLEVGPFYRVPVEFKDYRYRGVASSPKLEVALSYSGGLQIELIQQVNDEPSHYLDFIERHGPGLQHLSVTSESFDEDVARWKRSGWAPLVEGDTGYARVVFYETEIPGWAGSQMEVLELHPSNKMFNEKMMLDAQNWDGSDPVRRLG